MKLVEEKGVYMEFHSSNVRQNKQQGHMVNLYEFQLISYNRKLE
jgi:hypothetical protein